MEITDVKGKMSNGIEKRRSDIKLNDLKFNVSF